MLIVGIAGGSGSGKTTFARTLRDNLKEHAVIISQDSYYADRLDLPFEERVRMNYDHPDAIETDLLLLHLRMLREGKTIQVPVYDFSAYCRTSEKEEVAPKPVIIVEGILILAHPILRSLLDIKVYVDTDPDIRVLRRLRRDVLKRNRTLDSVREQYLATVKPMHEEFVEPSKRYADILVLEGGKNEVALSLVTSRLADYVNGL